MFVLFELDIVFNALIHVSAYLYLVIKLNLVIF